MNADAGVPCEGRSSKLSFAPRFPRSEAAGLVFRYMETGGKGDRRARRAGQAIMRGEYRREHLQVIHEWKNNRRGNTRPGANTDAEIKDALRLAVLASTPRAAVSVLVGLQGVLVPVASAILTCMRPKAFTILDFRALHALGVETSDRSVSYYLQYLEACRRLATEWGMQLRDFDRALWQWSKEQGRAEAD